MVAADTDFLVRLITGDPDTQAVEAKRIVAGAEARSILVDRVILAETLYVLRSNYNFSRDEALELLASLLKHRSFGFIDDDVCSNMLAILLATNFSPEDACLAALTKLGRVDSVVTFDVQLRKYLR